jgi:signal transduction histidine kinase
VLTPGRDPLLLVYVAAFGLAAAVCFGSVRFARRIDDPETRRGLVWLVLLSGAWAASHVGFLLAPGRELKLGFYLSGLVVGLATVGPWLYFCSAYTGRTLHRDPTYRWAAIVVFVVISVVKLTNPLHGMYVTAALEATPFIHLAVRPEPLHWLVAGLAYALTAFGGFMLFDRFRRAGADTTPLVVLVALTGLPVGLDLIGYFSPGIIDVTYEPLGVAAFAVGTLVLYRERFQAVRLTSDVDDPVVVLDGTDHVRDFNAAAADAFPALEGSIGQSLPAAVPDLATALPAVIGSRGEAAEGAGDAPDAETEADEPAFVDGGGEPSVIAVPGDDGLRYFQPSTMPVALGGSDDARRLVLTDVSGTERQRQALERQNERLERFGSAVSHDLRNPLNAANAQLSLARDQLDGENRHLDAVADEQARMEAMIEDLLTLAREGRAIGSTEPVSLATVAGNCWDRIAPEAVGPDLDIASDLRFEADPDRLQQVLENLFRNAVEHGTTADGADPSVRVGALADGDGFYVADDGPGIPEDRRERVFETGHTTAEGGTGFGLAIVREIVTAHGWAISVTESETGGARFEISGVERLD